MGNPSLLHWRRFRIHRSTRFGLLSSSRKYACLRQQAALRPRRPGRLYPHVRPRIPRCSVWRHNIGVQRLEGANRTIFAMVPPVRSFGWHPVWIPNRGRTHSDQQETVVAIVCAGDHRDFLFGLGSDLFAGRCDALVVGQSDPMGRFESDSDLLLEPDDAVRVPVSLADRLDEHALCVAAGEYLVDGSMVGRGVVCAQETEVFEDGGAANQKMCIKS